MPSISKRPPDKAGAARDVELSNAMCARALGGARKSWMIGDGQPSISTWTTQRLGPGQRHTNSSNEFAAAQVVPEHNHKKRSIATEGNLATRLASSSSFIPQDSRYGLISAQIENVLPSPAPSEEHRQDNIRGYDLEGEVAGGPSNTKPTALIDRTPRMTLSLDRELEPPQNSPLQEQNLAQPRDIQPLSASISEDALNSLTEAYGGLEEIRKRLRESDAPTEANVARTVQSPSATGQNPIGSVNETNRSETGSAIKERYGTSTVAPTGNSTEQIDQRRSAMVQKRISGPFVLGNMLSEFGQIILQRLKQIQGESGRLEVEVPRLTLLREAAEKNDIFYVMLHQTYCLNTLSPMVQSAAQFGFTAVHSKGLTVLSHLLLDNDRMGLDAINWFSKAPLSFELLLKASNIFRFTFDQILTFLVKVSQNWIRVKHESRLRNCPPSANEMAFLFGLHSLVLQGVLFRAVHREIWPGAQDHCFQNCEKVFHRYQDHCLTIDKSSAQLIVPENQAFQNEIKRIWAQHEGHGHHNVQQQLNLAQAHAPQMAPPQFRKSRFPEVTVPIGRGMSSQKRLLPGNARHRPPHTSTSSSQQAHSIPPGVYTPTVPSTPHNPPLTTEESSRMLPQQLPNGQRLRTGASSFTNLPPTQSSTMTTSAQSMSRQATASACPSWPDYQQIHNTVPAPAGNQIQNQARARANSSGHPSMPQNRHKVSSQFTASSRNIGQASSDRIRRRMYDQSPLPYAHSTSYAFAPSPTSQLESVNRHPHSDSADTGKPFLRPVPASPQATTSLSAFHQSHVVNPALEVVSVRPLAHDQKYFTYVEKVEICHERLHAQKRYLSWTLNLGKDEFELLAKARHTPIGHPLLLDVKSGSRICRIRCVVVNELDDKFTESDWVTTESAWPSGIAILLNGKALEVRKKLHYGKDLPIDITSLLGAGKNSFSVAISKVVDGSICALAVEVSEVSDTRTIKERIKKMDWSEARGRILRHSASADPDIEILDPRVTLNLTDPFTSYMCCLPVRGIACQHKQCFDLDIFLSTRSGKANEPCGPDQFRCPICGADARPKNLVMDGFLMKVREELQLMGRPDVKAIVLDENGDWQIKEEEQTGDPGDGIDRQKSESAAASAKSPFIRKESEIINLDDDD